MSTDKKFLVGIEHGQATSLLLLSFMLAITLFVGLRQAMARSFAPEATICVRPGGGDGCFDTINSALAAASAGDFIRVAAGDYVENVLVQKDVTLEGGWNEAFTERDPDAYVTTIRPETPEESVVSIVDADPVLDGFTITGGRAADGGIHSNADTQTTVISSTISFNTTDGSGGGVNDNGALTIAHSALHDNEAATNGGALNHAAGSATLFNVTLSGNRAADFGGGLRNHQDTEATFANVTIADNEATEGGGIYNEDAALLVNTIFARNAGGNCEALVAPQSRGHNLADDTSCGFDAATGDVITTQPGLGALADNGGPTLTHALFADSPAIDGGHPVICPQTDQRGVARPVDGDEDGIVRCDIGAFEKEPQQDEEEPGDRALYLPLISR